MNKDVEFDDVVYTVKQTRYFGKLLNLLICIYMHLKNNKP